MSEAQQTSVPGLPQRVASGIRGLDEILEGGFLAGGIYIVQGQPGSGKTIFGNQICFNHARRGGKALYLTLLAESHSRMLMHVGTLGFFDAALLPNQVYYASALPEIERNGINGLMALIRREVAAREVDLLVLDGLAAAESYAGSDLEFKKFIHALQVQAAMQDCTMFLLTSSGSMTGDVSAEHTMVDGVLRLASRLVGWRAERELQVLKRRGSGYLPGRHSFHIGDEGIVVYPRIEALVSQRDNPNEAGPSDAGGRSLPTGLPALDGMFGGGLPRGSTTLLIGPAGCGKTTLGLQFLSECSEAEPGLLLGFYESPAALCAKAARLRLRFSGLVAAGHVELLWRPTLEGLVDEACQVMLDAVSRRGVRRLFIDGYEGFVKLASDPSRIGRIFSALAVELRRRGATTLYTAQTAPLFSARSAPLAGVDLRDVSSIAENVVVMRLVENGVDLHRVISVVKSSEQRIDSRVREFEITDRGIVIDRDARRAEGVLRSAALRTEGGLAGHEPRNPGT